MTFLARIAQEELAIAANLSNLVNGHARGAITPHAPSGDSVIVIQMGPTQVPAVARILRSQWPSITALNFNQGQEFHVRLRQHKKTGVCLVYCSISWDDKHPRLGPDGKKMARPSSIFSEVVQRGRLCRDQSQFEAAIADIRRELGIGANLLPRGT